MENIAALSFDAWCFSLDSFVATDRTWEIHTFRDREYKLSKRLLTDLWQICVLVFPYVMLFISQSNNNTLYPVEAFFNCQLFGSAILRGASSSLQGCQSSSVGSVTQVAPLKRDVPFLTAEGRCNMPVGLIWGVSRERSLAGVIRVPCVS